MTRAETIAYNAGVDAVITLAKASAVAMAAQLVEKPTRFNFAIGALQALTEEGRALLITSPPATLGAQANG